MKENEASTSTVAIIGLVLAIIALILSPIPIVNNFAFVLAVPGIFLGLIGMRSAKKGKTRKSKVAVVAVVLSVLACGIVLASQSFYGSALDEVSESIDEEFSDATGDNTEELLANSVDVELGTFTITEDEFGLEESKLPVSITNKADESQSYFISIEAIDPEGNRITDDTVSVDDLGSGQSQNKNSFEFVTTDEADKLKEAEFKIVEVSRL